MDAAPVLGATIGRCEATRESLEPSASNGEAQDESQFFGRRLLGEFAPEHQPAREHENRSCARVDQPDWLERSLGPSCGRWIVTQQELVSACNAVANVTGGIVVTRNADLKHKE